MITFDSPIERCPVCRSYVLLDATQEQCAREHECPLGEQRCPLARFFEGDKYKVVKPDTPQPPVAE